MAKKKKGNGKKYEQTNGFKVIKELEPLRESDGAKLRVAIVRGRKKGERRLDIRQLFKFEGNKIWTFSKRGINIGSEEFDDLMNRRKKISKLLDK